MVNKSPINLSHIYNFSTEYRREYRPSRNVPVNRTAIRIFFFGYEGFRSQVCFQQCYPTTFGDENLPRSSSFPTSDHYMMYCKALLFENEVVAKKILAVKTPGKCKTLNETLGDIFTIVSLLRLIFVDLLIRGNGIAHMTRSWSEGTSLTLVRIPSWEPRF